MHMHTGSQFVECEVTADYEAGSAAELTVTGGETVMLISTETTGKSDPQSLLVMLFSV